MDLHTTSGSDPHLAKRTFRAAGGLLVRTTLLALAYFVLGRIGMTIAEPPGYAAPIWLPAGIAFFGVLAQGRTALPGVWLGSFLIHCWINWDRSGTLTFADMPIAIIIAAGATLQALVAAWLIRKRIGFPPPLIRGRDIFAYLSLAGPVSCFLNATLSVGILCVWKIVSWAEYPSNWLNWWVGDTLGTLLICIILLPAVGEPRAFWRPRIRKVTLPIGLLTAIVLGLFGAVRKVERDQFAETLTAWSANSARSFEHWFKNARVGVSAWSTYLREVPNASPNARKDFAKQLLGYHDTLRAVAVLEMVSHEKRAHLEGTRPDRPIPGGRIMEFDPKCGLVPATTRDWYAIPTTWHSLEPNAPAAWVDFAQSAEVRELLLRACESAEPVALPTYRFPFLVCDPNDLAIFSPLYRSSPTTSQPLERRSSLVGFDLSIVRMNHVLYRSSEQDISLPIQRSFVAETRDGDEEENSRPELSIVHAHYVVKVPARIGLAKVVLTGRAGAEYFATVRSRYVGVIFLLGLVIVGLFGVQLLLVTGETAIVTEEVRRRTAELRAEIAERERVEAERRLFDEKLRETQKLESLGVLAGGIAHDFNNILTSILGYAGMSQLQLPADSPVHSYLGQIDRSSRRAADLCQQMLAYAGKGRFVVEPRDLSQLAEDASDLLSLSISKKATLVFDLAANLPLIEADTNQLRQVIMNLVMNASEALGEESGRITLTTSVRRFERRSLDAMLHGQELPPGDYVCLDVVDTGCGMEAVALGRIFEPFYTTKFTGRGLGLAAVLGIMRSHGGALHVESVLGQGTSFRLLFPPSLSSSIEVPAPRANPRSELQGKGTILVVDDEDSVRVLTVLLLESIGFTVLEAKNGEEALVQFERHRDAIRTVLLDLTMPRLDGQEVFAEMHRLGSVTPVLLMTGFTEFEVRTRFTGASPAGFLQKPFGAEELIAALSAVLS